eukprot:TRINITY_DN18079_c0_g1_i1.p1 TRINITY_DN18079_c0_g1~~TRINITY_DN18079_c0_g1_i1.p1  ORF type:complete len:267 (+),score=78.15 TRINITY_DN18079_c0_g1_i1:16-816(+)
MPEPSPVSTVTPAASDGAARFRYDFRGARVMVGSCFDITPPVGGLTCEQQKELGKCARNWMLKGGFCAVTCGYCEDDCIEIQPTVSKTCAMELREGNCDNILADGFCRRTCGGNCPDDVAPEEPVETVRPEAAAGDLEVVDPTAPVPVPTPVVSDDADEDQEEEICDDVVPGTEYTCAQQKEFGKCEAAWMIAGNYCRKTCGRCGDVTVEDGIVEEVAALVDDKEEGDGECECACGCCTEQNTELITQIVQEAIQQVLEEMNINQK